jgi:dienelactone hydrolase
MKKLLFPFLFLISINATAQKKPLDHTVYDRWQSINERMISNDGAFVVYTVNPQEGDGDLVIQNPTTKYKKVIPRGYNATITEDSKYLLFKIKPLFQDTRQAKIKKKKADEMPKDSLGIIELGKDSVFKIARVKNYKSPEKGVGFIAYQLEKTLPDTTKKKLVSDSIKIKNDLLVKLADSLIRKSIDSIKGNITKEELIVIANNAAAQIILEGKDIADAEGDEATAGAATEGTDLILKNLSSNKETIFKLATEFYFDKQGNTLLIETSKKSKDSLSKALVLLYHLATQKTDTILKGFNDAKNFAMDEAGNQFAFVAERDSSEKSLQKFYKLFYYTAGQDSAKILVDKSIIGMPLGFTVSENAKVEFSKDGSKLFFGNAPIRSPKDTTLVDFETAKLDIWNYKDDYLQTQQLKNMDNELKRSYTAVYHIYKNKLVQLGADDAETITIVNEGNADWVLAESNKGNRVEGQWIGRTKSTAYIINSSTGERKIIYQNQRLNAAPSPAGKFVYWYDAALKNYFTYEVATGITRNVSASVKVPLYDEENDVPDLPNNYGVMGWQDGDSALFVYDRFNVWSLHPINNGVPKILFAGNSRQTTTMLRFINTDKDHRSFSFAKTYLFSSFNRSNKQSGLFISPILNANTSDEIVYEKQSAASRHLRSKNNVALSFSIESFGKSPDIYYYDIKPASKIPVIDSMGNILASKYFINTQLSNINPQQKDYNWGTAEIFSWKTYTGKTSTGIVYKPENFDPKKKYPMISYFYEKLSDGLYTYHNPAPTPSRLNISFFVSRGYIVFAPDISYTTGHPGNDAYNSIVSGARALVKLGFVDSTKLGLQGQSWGGYQTAYLITKTKLFTAAWAGAPVANMTSAYGGIRWESGLNRQMQYEKQQSRIGATLWEKPQLYIENSPLFHLPKVQTPLVIMSNDADGAVPWYQGIELFTALRRLGKPVWLLNYNGEAHNLIERRNRKDIQVREQQFFDWLLKGEKPARWLSEGVPAIDKGKDWGL